MINITGQFFDTSGYASHTRGLANALNKLTKVKLTTNLMPGWEKLVNDKELEMIKREQDYDINLVITHPLHWKSNMGAKRNWIYLIWEGDRVPKWILEECNNPNIEKIIVPSTHTKDAIINTLQELDANPKWNGSPLIIPKIKIIPHGVDNSKFYPTSQRKKDKDDGSNDTLSGATNQLQGQTKKDEHMPVSEDNHADTFKFLANKGLRNLEDRGGIPYLINAYLEEFTESDKVELILKINSVYGVPNLLKLFPGIKQNGVPKIRFIHENYTTKQMNELYNECDVFVSPTRAEAFNLPCLEAMACGKPVITTNFGGQTDFVNSQNGFMLGYDLVKAPEIEYEECQWAIPNITELKSNLRYCYEHPNDCKRKGSIALKDAKELTWDNTAQQIFSLIAHMDKSGKLLDCNPSVPGSNPGMCL